VLLLSLLESLGEKLEGAEDRLKILLHCLRVKVLGHDKIDIVVILMVVQDCNSRKVIPNIVLVEVGSILLRPLVVANGWFVARGWSTCNASNLLCHLPKERTVDLVRPGNLGRQRG